MEQLSVLIVEDDFSFSLELEMLVKEVGYNVLAAVDNAAEALELIFTSPPDLILMDIEIKGKMSGIDIAEKTKHLDIPVLFITSVKQEEQYSRAKQTNFVGYMVKPLDEFSLRSSIELAIRSLNLGQPNTKDTTAFPFKESLFFKNKGVYRKVKIDTISYIESDGNYSITYVGGDKLVTSITITELEELLEDYRFMRIHRRFLINLEKVSHLDTVNNKVIIEDYEIPLSRTKKQDFLKNIKLIQ